MTDVMAVGQRRVANGVDFTMLLIDTDCAAPSLHSIPSLFGHQQQPTASIVHFPSCSHRSPVSPPTIPSYLHTIRSSGNRIRQNPVMNPPPGSQIVLPYSE